MGSKIIIRNADFSANAVAQTPTYHTITVGSSEAIWEQATITGTNGTFGALVQEEGYVTALRMYAPTDGTVKSVIRVYQKNGNLKGEYDVLSSFIQAGTHTYRFITPIHVVEDDVVCISGQSGAFAMKFKSSGGDYPVSTSNGNVPDSGWRIYPFNFIMQAVES